MQNCPHAWSLWLRNVEVSALLERGGREAQNCRHFWTAIWSQNAALLTLLALVAPLCESRMCRVSGALLAAVVSEWSLNGPVSTPGVVFRAFFEKVLEWSFSGLGSDWSFSGPLWSWGLAWSSSGLENGLWVVS